MTRRTQRTILTPDFDAIATLMLSAQHDAYGVREVNVSPRH